MKMLASGNSSLDNAVLGIRLAPACSCELLVKTLAQHQLPGNRIVPIVRNPSLGQALSFPLGQQERLTVLGQVYTPHLQIAHLAASEHFQVTMSYLAPWWVPHTVIRHDGLGHQATSDVVLNKPAGHEYLAWDDGFMGTAAPTLEGKVVLELADGMTIDSVEDVRRLFNVVQNDGHTLFAGTLGHGTHGTNRSMDADVDSVVECRIRLDMFVEAQALGSMDTAVDRVAEMLDDSIPTPLVMLASGFFGKVIRCTRPVPLTSTEAREVVKKGDLVVMQPLGCEHLITGHVTDLDSYTATQPLMANCLSAGDTTETYGQVTDIFIPYLPPPQPDIFKRPPKSYFPIPNHLAMEFSGLSVGTSTSNYGYVSGTDSSMPSLAARSPSQESDMVQGKAGNWDAVSMDSATVTSEVCWGDDVVWADEFVVGDTAWGQGWSESQLDEVCLQVQEWKDSLTPRLAALQEECFVADVDVNDAEALATLAPTACPSQIVRCLVENGSDLAKAADALFLKLAQEERDREEFPLIPDEVISHSFTSKRKKRGKCKGRAIPLDQFLAKQSGSEAQQKLHAMPAVARQLVDYKTITMAGVPIVHSIDDDVQEVIPTDMRKPDTGPSRGVHTPHYLKPARTHTDTQSQECEAHIPDFLLEYLAEHMKVEEDGLVRQARQRPSIARNPWTKVVKKDNQGNGQPTMSASRVTLRSSVFRKTVHEELIKVAESETVRHRMLTVCSTAAGRGATFDKHLLFLMKDLLQNQKSVKSNVMQAHRIAAQNTSLSGAPAEVDLHFMSRDYAVEVLQTVVQALRKAGQSGTLHFITGRGSHSHNSRSALKPVVLNCLEELNLKYATDPFNDGVIAVELV